MSQTNTLLATTRTAQLTIGDNTTSFRHCPSVHTPTIFHFGFMSIKSLTVVNGNSDLGLSVTFRRTRVEKAARVNFIVKDGWGG